MMKFCKDCKHYRTIKGTTGFDQCTASPENFDIVTGERIVENPRYMRSLSEGGCGLEAVLFEPKDE